MTTSLLPASPDNAQLLGEIRQIIKQGREQAKLHEAIARLRARLENREEDA